MGKWRDVASAVPYNVLSKHPVGRGIAPAAILCSAVSVNIGVWLPEQLVHTDFGLLSISYPVSEIFLIFLYLMLQELQAAPAQSLPRTHGSRPGAGRLPCRKGFTR